MKRDPLDDKEIKVQMDALGKQGVFREGTSNLSICFDEEQVPWMHGIVSEG